MPRLPRVCHERVQPLEAPVNTPRALCLSEKNVLWFKLSRPLLL